MSFKHKAYKLLKHIEKYTKTDMVYLTTGTFWLTANQITNTALTFVLAVAFANILTVEAFGTYRFVLSIAAVIASFSLTGLNIAIIRDVAKGAKGLLKIAFITQMKWSAGTLLAALLLAGYYFIQGNTDLVISTILMGVFVPIISSANTYIPYWEGRKDYRKIGIFSITTTAIYVTFVFITIHLTTYVPIIVFVYYVTQALCAYFFYRQTLKFDEGINDISHNTINFGKHLSFLNILSTIAAQLDKILVFHYLGAAQLALYTLSQIPLNQTRALLKPITQLAFPKYSEKSLADIRISIYRKMIILTIPIIVMVVIYIILAPFIFKVFFPKYIDAVLYSQVGILSLLFFQKKLVAYTALAHASKKVIYGMSVYASLSKITLLLILLPMYGIWGAIFTEFILQALSLVTSLLVLKRL